MIKLYEKDITQAYIGKPYNEHRYSELFNKGNYFFPSHCDIKTELKFNITFAMRWGWKEKNIDFRIYVRADDDMISSCYIDKRKDNYFGLYVRNPHVSLKPTQQELRLFKRVMEYITTLDAEE